MAIALSDNIQCSSPKVLDWRYGPWTGVTHALANLPTGIGTWRAIGLTVGVVTGATFVNPFLSTGGTLSEYWFYSGITDADLVLKLGGSVSSPAGATDPNFYYDTATDTLYTPNLVLSGTVLENSYKYTGLTSNTVVSTVILANYNGAFFDYYVKNGSNMRIGTVMATWDASNVTYTDYSSADIGNTNPIEFTVDISSPNIRLNAVITSGTWVVQTGIRLI